MNMFHYSIVRARMKRAGRNAPENKSGQRRKCSRMASLNSKLEHLILYPKGGLCNRMRAIASARRLCSRAGARCTIAWDWGDYRAVFEDDTEWVPYDPLRDTIPNGFHHIRNLLWGEGGTTKNRRIPVTVFSH